MKTDIWKRMIRRYAVVSVIGLVACVILFWQLALIPAGQMIPRWLVFAAVLAGLAFFSGLFGLGVSVFFRIWSRKQL